MPFFRVYPAPRCAQKNTRVHLVDWRHSHTIDLQRPESMEAQINTVGKALALARKFWREACLLFLLWGNVQQYRDGRADRTEYTKFYHRVYNTEVNRSTKWENIAITLRELSR